MDTGQFIKGNVPYGISISARLIQNLHYARAATPVADSVF